MNDTFGHEIGDLLLQIVAEKLKTVCGRRMRVSAGRR
ncbi:diguanylate cyclase [Pseudomonas sp. PCH446]